MMKIGDIASTFGVSHRSLHYWEDMGIIKSSRAENEYRYYDEENQSRIRQIVILRKLRLPLKNVIAILASDSVAEVIETLQNNLSEVDNEITSLSTIRSILDTFITQLNQRLLIDVKVNLLDDSSILDIVDSLTLHKPALKKSKAAEDLAEADAQLHKLKDQAVRIVYLPPAGVASALGIGSEAEHESDVMMARFIDEIRLFEKYPGVRLYGFNNPEFDDEGAFVQHRYEVWATIPDDLPVPAPLEKKHFRGGLYAAYTSNPISFDDWKPFGEWLADSGDFEYDESRSYRKDRMDSDRIRCSGWGGLEEHFNSYNIYGLSNRKYLLSHIDFLIPIREKGV